MEKFKYVAIDGICRGFLLFLPAEAIAIVSGENAFCAGLVTTLVCIVLSIILYVVLMRRIEEKFMRFYLLGQACFVVTIMCLLLNYIGLHLFLFPRREMADAEGFIVIFFLFLFLLLSETIRFMLCVLRIIKKKISKKS